MRMIANNDLPLQSLSYIENEVFYFIRNFRTRHPVIFIPLTNIANRFQKCTRTVKRILKSLVEKGFITRIKRGWGHTSFTVITEIGERFAQSRMKKNVPSDVPSATPIYLRSKSLKGSKRSPYPKTEVANDEGGRVSSRALGTNPRALSTNPRAMRQNESVVENKVVALPKLIGEGFVKTAKRVLAKINCALQIKVAKEFDAYAAKTPIRSPIAFLKFKIQQLSEMQTNAPVVAVRIATEQLKNEIKAKALEMAKDELKRKGEVYPVFIPGISSSAQHFDEVQAYGIRETELYRFYVSKLENENKLTKSNC